MLNCCHSSLKPNVGQIGGRSEQQLQENRRPQHSSATDSLQRGLLCLIREEFDQMISQTGTCVNWWKRGIIVLL